MDTYSVYCVHCTLYTVCVCEIDGNDDDDDDDDGGGGDGGGISVGSEM